MRISAVAAVAVVAVGCSPAASLSPPTDVTTPTAPPTPLTLETAGCWEWSHTELPSAEDVRAARETDPDAYGPTDLRVLLETSGAAAAESASAWPDDEVALEAQHWRDLMAALDADSAGQHVDAGASDRFRYGIRGMQTHAVRIAGVWFTSSEGHAMPDSYCEDGVPAVSADGVLGLECPGGLRESGVVDHPPGASGISDDPFVVARAWVDTNVREPSELTLAPFEDAAGRVGDDIAVLRAGGTIAVLDIFGHEDGGLLVGAFTACATELAVTS